MRRLVALAPLAPLALSFAVGVALVALLPCNPPAVGPDPASVPAGPARRVAELLRSGNLHPSPEPAGPVYVALRAKGRRLAEGWFDGPRWGHAIVRGVTRLAARSAPEHATYVELCLPHGYRRIGLRRKDPVMGNIHRGVRGLELARTNQLERACPTQMIANNLSFEKVEQRFMKAGGLARARYLHETRARAFDAHQLLVDLEARRVTPMWRGNQVVEMSEVNGASVRALAAAMADWMLAQLHDDGRMTYKYWPSRGEESDANNMIRQFMASLCLVRIAAYRDDATIVERALGNVRYNLEHFYQREGELGVIRYRGKAKLGAAALAALAIVEAPFRAELAEYETALRAAVEHMQQSDGSFHTFFGSDRTDNQNFYPGETLLLWSALYAESRDPALLERIMRSFRYYRQWHREHKNPAFIPWHTQAYYRVWQLTKDRELSDFVFEMNDWLLDFQEWNRARYDDTRGRFYDPDKDYGPPHASSTGVYLEGLIDAYRLARELGDDARTSSYRTAILRGLRSLMQLQFADDVDMYYVAQRDRVRGGLRTTVYDNTIRVDNVQHSLMATMKIITTFDGEASW